MMNVYVNGKALSRSRVVRLVRKGRSHRTFVDSTRKWDIT
jgi:hypothetical protein